MSPSTGMRICCSIAYAVPRPSGEVFQPDCVYPAREYLERTSSDRGSMLGPHTRTVSPATATTSRMEPTPPFGRYESEYSVVHWAYNVIPPETIRNCEPSATRVPPPAWVAHPVSRYPLRDMPAPFERVIISSTIPNRLVMFPDPPFDMYVIC